jgi:putative Ca2+/H+ antiporter (TMEM165/GDT1 family)
VVTAFAVIFLAEWGDLTAVVLLGLAAYTLLLAVR